MPFMSQRFVGGRALGAKHMVEVPNQRTLAKHRRRADEIIISPSCLLVDHLVQNENVPSISFDHGLSRSSAMWKQ